MIPPLHLTQPLVGMADYTRNYFSEISNCCYISWFFFSKHNGLVLPFSIVIFSSFSAITPKKWVRPLDLIADYIASTFLSDLNITIYHRCFLSAQWRLFNITIVYSYVLKFFYDYSSWMTAITCWDHRFHWKYCVA